MSEQRLRAAYASTALARLGIAFEDAMRRAWVRAAVEAAARTHELWGRLKAGPTRTPCSAPAQP